MTAHGILDADNLISLYCEQANKPASDSDEDTKDIEAVRFEIKQTIGEMRQQLRHQKRERLFALDDRCWPTVLLHYTQAMLTNHALRTLILRCAECRAWLRLPSQDYYLHSHPEHLAMLDPIMRYIYQHELHDLGDGAEGEAFKWLRGGGIDECIDGFWVSDK